MTDQGGLTQIYRVPLGQYQTLCALLVDGCDNRTLARRLGVSVETVKTQLRRLYGATGYHTRAELITAIARGEVKIVPFEPGDPGYKRPTNPAFWARNSD